MAPAARLQIATACPECAAPLEVAEGTTAVRCTYCGVRLLLTGRRDVLAYQVPPRLNAAQACAKLAAAARPADAELCFLPYYRFSAEEYRWQWPKSPAPKSVGELLESARTPAPEPVGAPELVERAIERNFLACAWDGLGLYSLGVRPSALRLVPLHAASVAMGHVVAAEISPNDALAHALRTDDERLLHRAVLGGVLSLVFFPFWTIPRGVGTDTRIALVDAMTGTITTSDGPPELRARLAQRTAVDYATATFKPLVCPNCGWDFPDDAQHVVFFCGQCRRAWQVEGDGLHPLASTVVRPETPAREKPTYLPLWIVDVHGAGSRLSRVTVPAFRYRAHRLLLGLATMLTRRAVSFERDDGEQPELCGASLDREDAIVLARFIATGIDREAARALEVTSAELVWWPFEPRAGSLREPVTGFAIPTNLLGAAPAAPLAGVRSAPSAGPSGPS